MKITNQDKTQALTEFKVMVPGAEMLSPGLWGGACNARLRLKVCTTCITDQRTNAEGNFYFFIPKWKSCYNFFQVAKTGTNWSLSYKWNGMKLTSKKRGILVLSFNIESQQNWVDASCELINHLLRRKRIQENTSM